MTKECFPKRYGKKLAAFAGFIATSILAEPSWVFGLMGFVDDPKLKLVLAAGGGLLVFAIANAVNEKDMKNAREA